MPLPVLISIGLGVISSLLVGATIALKWDDIIIALQGKKLAVLGARGVGKTHLTMFLSSGSIPVGYKQTVAPDKRSSRRFQLNELDLKVKDTLDLAGDKAAYAEWKELHDQSDVILYLFRADRLIAGDIEVEARVRGDLRHIGEWLEERSPRPSLFIIGTHCDLDSEFASLSANRQGDYVDKFRKLPIISELVARGGGPQVTKLILGSMKTIQDTEVLVYQLFIQAVS